MNKLLRTTPLRAGFIGAFSLGLLALAGCNGGGGSSATDTPAATETTITISGVAGAGPISGQACAYSLTSGGTVGTTALACGTTNASTGAFSLSVKDYVGAVLVKAFGSYKDEASGLTKTVDEANALRSTLNCATAGSSCTAAVTVLTEAAVRSATSLAATDLEAAYLKVAKAYGVTASTAAEAISQLVTTTPDFTSRNNANAARYADLLALASQAQAQYCGATSTCTVESYLAALKSSLAGTNGIEAVQSAVNAAIAAWNSNALNTSKVACAFSGGTLTCTLPTNGSGGSGGSGGSSGSYKLTVTVTASGVSVPAVVINNVPKPDSQAGFCDDTTVTQQLQSSLNSFGTWTLNSCTFSGNSGTITATVNVTQPLPVSFAYTVKYDYSPL